MSQEAVEKLIGRLLTDDDFRENAAAGFSKACFEAGFDLTDAEQKIVRSIDFGRFAFLSEELDKRIKRSRRALYSKGRPLSDYGEADSARA